MQKVENTRQAEFRLEQKLAATFKCPVKLLKKEYIFAGITSDELTPLGSYPFLREVNSQIYKVPFHSVEARVNLVDLFVPEKFMISKLYQEWEAWEHYDSEMVVSIYIGNTLWMFETAPHGELPDNSCLILRTTDDNLVFKMTPFKQWVEQFKE